MRAPEVEGPCAECEGDRCSACSEEIRDELAAQADCDAWDEAEEREAMRDWRDE